MDTGLIGRLDPPDAAADRRGGRATPRRLALAAGGERASDDPFDAPRRLAPRRRARPAYWQLAVNGGEPFDVGSSVKVLRPPLRFAGEWLGRGRAGRGG